MGIIQQILDSISAISELDMAFAAINTVTLNNFLTDLCMNVHISNAEKQKLSLGDLEFHGL
jgi:hypothetical protein